MKGIDVLFNKVLYTGLSLLTIKHTFMPIKLKSEYKSKLVYPKVNL